MFFDNSIWEKKIRSANKVYEAWEQLFKCEKLQQYYEGRQWGTIYALAPNYVPYTLNLVFSAIKTKLASFTIKNPQFQLLPTPGNMDWDQEFAMESALLKEGVLNAITSNVNLNYERHLKLVALDSMFRFGIMETDYAANWENPLKKPTITTEFSKQDVDPTLAKFVDDDPLPSSEMIYFKHINARRFRVSTGEDSFLRNSSWCGYWMPVYESTIRNSKNLKLPTAYNFGEMIDVSGTKRSKTEGSMESAKVLKIWKIWDNEQSRKHLFIDGYFNESLETKEVKFDVLPFDDMTWNDRAPGSENAGFYPIPPVYNWLSPQDEVNQAREQMRNFRRRYTRKFGFVKGKVTTEELDKFRNEYDGEMIEMKEIGAIFPIENPNIGATITNDLVASNDDFNKVAAVSQVQPSDRTTATQSKINAARETLREDTEAMDFAEFVSRTGRKALYIAKEKLVLPIWIKYGQDPSADLFGEVSQNGPLYKSIQAQQIDDGNDFTIELHVLEGTPEQMQQQQTAYLTFMKIFAAFPAIAMSPTLITETAYVCGYRNLKVIKELQKMALVQMVGMAAAGNANVAGQGNAAEASMTANANPNPDSEIDKQLETQLQ